MKAQTKRKLAQLTKHSLSFGLKIGSFKIFLMIVLPHRKPKKKYEKKRLAMYA